MQVLPESQTVQPVQLVPPHWAYLAAVQTDVEVAAAEEVVVVVGALEVVDAAEVELLVDVAVLDAADEEEPPPDEPEDDINIARVGDIYI